MKKLIFILSFVGLFFLVSCDKTPTPATSSSNDTVESTPSQEKTTPVEENSESKEETNNKDKIEDVTEKTDADNSDDETKTTDNTSPIGSYDDGEDWHGKID